MDLNGVETVVSTLQINTTFSNATTEIIATDSTLGTLQTGDRIRVPGSTTPLRTFVVMSTDYSDSELRFIIDAPIMFTSAAEELEDVYKIDGGVPDFTVATVQEGEDSYYYDVFFTGRQHGNVPQLTVSTCDSFAQFNGMRYSVDVDTVA